ncbi:MAG: hypothetical protein AABY10_02250 [Nanoarchaeota archaeon]
MKDRPAYGARLILAFLVATLIYIIIFSLASSVSYLNYQKINITNNIIKNYNIELEKYLNDSSCDENIFVESSEKLDDAGSKLSLLETRFGKNDFRVLEQKIIYTDLEYKHYTIMKKLKEKCSTDLKIVLFIYSNSKNEEKESEKVGNILSALKNKYKSKLMIYSFDSNLQSKIIQNLKLEYEIDNVPTVVYDSKIIEVNDINDLENVIFQSNKQ